MYPILFKFGPIKIFTYGFFLALAFLSAIYLAAREAERLGLPVAPLLRPVFLYRPGGPGGLPPALYLPGAAGISGHPLKIFAIWEGGLVFHGGVVLALVVAFYYMTATPCPGGPLWTPWPWACPWARFSGAWAASWPAAATARLPICPGP